MPRLAALALALCLSTPAAADGVLFTAFDGNDWGLYTVVPGDAAKRRFTGETRGAVIEGGLLAFADPAGHIYVQDAALTERRSEPIDGLPGPCAQPTLAPAANRLVVACFRFANRQDDGAFWQVSLPDRTATPLFDGPGLQKSPVFSPDGQMIAFVSGFRLSAERVIEHVWVMQADGSGARPVADASDVNIDPTWVDAQTLVISSDRDRQGQKLWRIDLATGDARPLTEGPTDMEAAALPDGRLAFLAERAGRFALVLAEPGRTATPQPLAVTGDDGLEAAHDPVWIRETAKDD